ncbi:MULTISPECIES: opine oxidase subunit OoxA [Rhizobium/Agrobacterium group]|uniref:opine oxidase subunit OoxA n=1 Tax=Rhizobium/Agrobacterium group TaxID=227290 RepID=UPI0015730CCE|nr:MULTISPECIES: opine oxidase subunit OoxA [Rhizobium/Agrobacterium group]NSZ66720.1 FAD-dependent oxidoreductase [Agrobacterium tumefaciens]NTA19600.1 FAD-dependent oxidoreductase [Agrobacterium tumefaciens]NTA73169.1 FAD-dependent oxidoreductase [Agrobacterium tumefaciens]NTJ11839.1 FAD-dependent oxidoreductase [Rhizobium lusitanum]WCK74935.1 opine oxidase subunit OoxA [Agrobacterium tumefaciens]
MTLRKVSVATDLSDFYDLLVIGAGPAGMAAAVEASASGARVAVLDENPRPGGQIYREITRNSPDRRTYLGPDYWKGQPLAEAFCLSNVDYASRATVWSLETRDKTAGQARNVVGVTVAGSARMVETNAVVLATGAQERPMPVPGWTLPGVMTAGAAQIALKAAGAMPAAPVVLIGCGPLLYLLASQLVDAGVPDLTVLDTAQSPFRGAVLRHMPEFLLSPYVLKGIGLLLKVRRHAQVVYGVRSIAIIGSQHAESVRYAVGQGERSIPAKSVLLHQGVIPSTSLSNAAGCELQWNDEQRAFQPVTDHDGRTTKAGIYVAGDGAGIAGAQAAEVSGRLAALAALADLKLVSTQTSATSIKSAHAQARRFLRGRAFLDALYTPRQSFLAPSAPETIVCRCEEITVRKLREAIALGPPGPNQLKTFVRCGMGQCQGRLCAATVTEIMAEERKVSPADVGTYRLRSPVKPVRLAELAHLPHTARALKAVTGRDPVDHDATETGHIL